MTVTKRIAMVPLRRLVFRMLLAAPLLATLAPSNLALRKPIRTSPFA
jgi:hypothetical protein